MIIVLLLGGLLPAAEIPVVMAVEPSAPSGAFYDGEPVRFALRREFGGNCRYRVEDWSGESARSGEFSGTLELSGLPRGYYTLTLDDFSEPLSFAILPDASKRKPNPESFFAVDTAQSWLSGAQPWNERMPGEHYERISELCRRAGFGMIRDRFGWKHAESEPGASDWGSYGKNADLLAGRGVAVCSVLDMTPDWAKSRSTHYPDDLIAAYRFAGRLAETFRGKITAWEFFNETDSGSQGPAWTLAAATKAASLGFRSADPELKLLNSSFHLTPLQFFAHSALKSDLGFYFDIFNYHVYDPIADYPRLISRLRIEMAAHGLEKMPIWLTENGTNAEGIGEREAYRPGNRAHSPAQELAVAEFIVKSQIIMQSLGVAKDFFFVMPPYREQEGRKDWGLLRMDLTVKPGFAAFAVLNDQLADARYLGTVELGENIRGFLYELPDGSRTLAFWCAGPLDGREFDGKERRFRLAQPDGEYVLTNLFGTPERVCASNGVLELSAGIRPAYLAGLRGTEPSHAAPEAGVPGAQKGDADLTIVFHPVLGDGFQVADSRAFAELTAPAGKVVLEVFNLSPETKTGVVSVRGGGASGLPEQVEIGPFSKVKLPLEIVLEKNMLRSDLEFCGTFNGRKATRSVVPLIQTDAILEHGRTLALDCGNPERWRNNSSGTMEFSRAGGDGALKLRTTYRPGSDRWSYPEYLLNLPEESLEGAIGLAFEIKAGPEISHGVGFTAAMAVQDLEKEHGKAVWMKYPDVTGEWEKRMVIFSGFDPAETRMLRIGMNPNCDDFTYYIRNVRVIFDR